MIKPFFNYFNLKKLGLVLGLTFKRDKNVTFQNKYILTCKL